MRMSRMSCLGLVALTVAGAAACSTTVASGTPERSFAEPAASEIAVAMPTVDAATVPEEPAEASPLAAPDLAAIVLAPDAAPAGVHNDTVVEGTPVLTRVVISGRDLEFLGLTGFAAGRYSQFSGEGGLLLSLGLLFDTDTDAERAFDLYLDELRSDEGYGAGAGAGGVGAGLGQEGTCAEFDNPALDGLHENACLWRQGTLVLLAGGTLERDVIRSIADGMDARALSELEP